MRLSHAACAAAAFLAALAGCDGDPETTRVKGNKLTVYSSLPLRGSSAEAARAVAAGQRLALDEVNWRVGRYRIRLVEMDSTKADSSVWDPAQVSANAERAVDDPTAIAYIGELDYGGSAVSLPITNDKGLLQVSPLDGLTSLTRRVAPSAREGPERYYPSEQRTFLRLVPNDLRVARALVEQIHGNGALRLSVIADESIYGRELAGQVIRAARSSGLDTASPLDDRDEPQEVPSLAEEVADQRPDAVVYSGTAGTSFAALLTRLRAELPRAPVWGGTGLAAAAGTPPVGPGPVAWLQPVRRQAAYPRAARRLLRRVGSPRAEALYGYESMRRVLDAIEDAGSDRRAVARSALAPVVRSSPLGRYRVLPGGDVSERRLAVYELGPLGRG